MRLLLLSNSTNAGEEYLEWPEKHIKNFLGSITENIIFIPYAAISISWDEYFENVSARFESWGIALNSIHRSDNPAKEIKEADAIIVGGGNTFNLLKNLQDNKLIQVIRNRIYKDIPYIGWSAGSNICCPTISTTNDMPVVEPDNFKGLNLIPFQINPHYTDIIDPSHAGETRDERLAEYLKANPDMYVIGLREASLIRVENNQCSLIGKPARLFKYGKLAENLDSDFSFTFFKK